MNKSFNFIIQHKPHIADILIFELKVNSMLFMFIQVAVPVKPQGPGKMAGVRRRGPDGLPVLPPIERPKTREDPYANSKLLTFRMAKHREDLLTKIMYV